MVWGQWHTAEGDFRQRVSVGVGNGQRSESYKERIIILEIENKKLMSKSSKSRVRKYSSKGFTVIRNTKVV